MTYDPKEISLADGQPNELYEFQIGAVSYKYTSGEDEITIDSKTYVPLPISRTSLKADISERNEILTVTMPASEEFPHLFINIVPGQIATFNLKRYHRTDTGDQTIVVFYGRVLSVSFQENGVSAQLSIKTLATNLNTQMPRRTYQSLCNWVLYDPDCGVPSSSHQFSGTVSLVDGNTITVPGLTASKGDQWSTGGFVAQGGIDFRFVVKQKNADLGNDVIQLLLPFNVPMTGAPVDIFAGCGHDINTCSSKFSNVKRFGGCAWVPTKNIFITGID